MIDIDNIKKEIIDALSPINPERVVLFGSFANGTAGEDSDVDLYVVTRDDFMPQNWEEKNAVYLNVSSRIRPLRGKTPIDLIVHTKKMYNCFVEQGSFFSREIENSGVRLI